MLAFLPTTLCWNRIGLFNATFHPAYGEDLDYRDCLRATPEVDWLPGGETHRAMAERNPTHNPTIASDPWLMEHGRLGLSIGLGGVVIALFIGIQLGAIPWRYRREIW